jgi:predicted RNase H-like nuclease
MRVLGIDGCKGGWIYIGLDSNEPCFGVVKTIKELTLLQDDYARYLIDIPIGLIDTGAERECDRLSRRLLGQGRGSSVFPSPTRQAIYCSDYREASALNHQFTGRKLSKQSWAISPKIRELDELLASEPNLKGKIREVHPELLFYGLAGGKPMRWSKRTPEGFMERIDLLDSVFPEAKILFTSIRESTKPSIVAADDILDAMAAAVSGSNPDFLMQTVPIDPPRDQRGLHMEMVYPVSHRR